jgi:hypothetical protein
MVSQRELEGLRDASTNEVLKRSDRRKKNTIGAQNAATTATAQRPANQHASRRSSQRNKKGAETEESDEEAPPVKDAQKAIPSSPKPPAAPTLTLSEVHTVCEIVPVDPYYRDCKACGDETFINDFPRLEDCPTYPRCVATALWSGLTAGSALP